MNSFAYQLLNNILKHHPHLNLRVNLNDLGYTCIDIETNKIALICIDDIQGKQINPELLIEIRKKNSEIGYLNINIWQHQYIHKKEILLSRINSLLGSSVKVYARKTIIKRLNKPFTESFLNTNHLQGWATARYKYGLYIADICYAVITFSNPKTFINAHHQIKSYELVHFANKNNYTVVGGLSRLIDHFKKEINPDEIMTYIDLDWSDGKKYKNLGFKEIEVLAPISFYFDERSGKRINQKKLSLITIENEKLHKVFNTGSLKLKWFKH